MKNNCLFALVFFVNYLQIFGQSAIYMPIDTSNLMGEIKKCSIYEYSVFTSEFSEEVGEKEISPSIILTFSPSKRIKEVSYPNSKKKRIFLYDDEGRLIVEFSGNKDISSELDYLNKSTSFSQFDYQTLCKNKLISEVKKYHYSDDVLMITSSNNSPPNFIYFDNYNKIIKTVQFYYEKGILKKSTTELTYNDSQMKSEKIIFSTTSKQKSEYEYDERNRLLAQTDIVNTPNRNLIKLYTSNYQENKSKYLVIEKGSIIEEVICENKDNKRMCKIKNGNKEVLSEVSFFDKRGNKIKEYRKADNKYHVKEWCFEYY